MIVPRGTYVVIQPDKRPDAIGSILLPQDTEYSAPSRGTVVSVGPDVSEVNVGDTVHYEKFDHSAAAEGQIIIKEGEILAREQEVK